MGTQTRHKQRIGKHKKGQVQKTDEKMLQTEEDQPNTD